MALVVKIDGYDLSDYAQAMADPYDPADAFSEPQFAGNSLTDGDLFVSMTSSNREWTLPLLIVSTSNDALAATVREINSHLKPRVTLEYREDGASNSTYFDVESAVLEADYRYQRNRQGVGKFTLKVWSRPFGHTGTTRIVATGVATGLEVIPIASLGLTGDAVAGLKLSPSFAQASIPNAEQPQIYAWGVTSRASFKSQFLPEPTSGIHATFGDGIYLADAGAVSGTAAGLSPSNSALIRGFAVGGLTTLGSNNAYLPQRLFASIRVRAHASGYATDDGLSPSTYPAYLEVEIDGQRTSQRTLRGANAFASAFGTASQYNLYDLGTIVPGQQHVFSPRVRLRAMATNVATTLASPFVLIDAVYSIPNPGAYLVASCFNVGNKSMSVDGALATVVNSVDHFSLIGEYPKVEADNLATGLLILLTSRTSGLPLATEGDYRKIPYTVAARERFKYFR
jgi:hypothetical protein